uniref:Yip1 domain-containing protein n=1 Tax=viral metagenome TaxID=1070528 RepID=A0A6C0ASI6_9ZZZZ
MAVVGFRNLCSPAYVYLVISVIALLVMTFQNIGNVNLYCLGTYNCSVTNTTLIFIIKAVYIVFWTWVLNLICRAGATNLAWFLVLLPFILMFVFIALILFS